MENILGKGTTKDEKNENENWQLFVQKRYKLKILDTKTSILSDHENVVFIFEKIFASI